MFGLKDNVTGESFIAIKDSDGDGLRTCQLRVTVTGCRLSVNTEPSSVAGCTAGAPPGAAGPPSQASRPKPGRAREGRCHCQSDSRPVEPRSL